MRPPSKKTSIHAVDLFCGAGGTSTGLMQACQALGVKLDLFAINHWRIAVETHAQNHPSVNHMCADVDQVNPRKAAKRGGVDLLVASPECTHHSIARGGKPKNEQGRASAWSVLRWIEELQPAEVVIENVREFTWWSPLRKDGRRDGRYRRGSTYEAWLEALRSLGYQVDTQLLICADYGDPTTRLRLFIRARRGWKQPAWPAHTHAKVGNGLPMWRTAREIIDWKHHGRSIFGRKRPLAENTLKRIEAGIRKFWGKWAEPFLVVLNGGGWQGTARSVDKPCPTVVANGNHVALVEPFLLPHRTFKNMNADSIGKPLRTVTGHSAGFALVEPFITSVNHGKDEKRNQSPDEPLPTVTGVHGFGIVEPFITIMKGQSTVRSIDEPTPTVTSNPHLYVCEPFLVNYHGDHAGKDDSRRRVKPIGEPRPTVDCANRYGLCAPFLVKFYGTGGAKSVEGPLDAVTTRDRFGLVEPGEYLLDILFRMLEPMELAKAQGFPGDYRFAGTRRDQVKQIANAVPVNTARELCREALTA